MYSIVIGERNAWITKHGKFSGRNYYCLFVNNISEAVSAFKKHFFKIADEHCKSIVSFGSEHIDFSKMLLVNDGDEFHLQFCPFQSEPSFYLIHTNKKRSWEYVCQVLGFQPRLHLCKE